MEDFRRGPGLEGPCLARRVEYGPDDNENVIKKKSKNNKRGILFLCEHCTTLLCHFHGYHVSSVNIQFSSKVLPSQKENEQLMCLEKLFVKENTRSFPDARSVLWPMITMFKILGVSPVNVRWTSGRNGRKSLRATRSCTWFSLSLSLFVITIIHTLWAPTMLIRLEKAVMSEFSKFKPENLTEEEHEGLSSKQTMVVKVIHPLLICIMSLAARGTSVSVLPGKIPGLIRKINKVEHTLDVPRRVCRKDCANLLCFIILFLGLNIPLMTYHVVQLSFFHSGWGNVWEAFSMFNIFTTFSMELQFMTFCYLARSRFIYVNTKLTGFVADEFTSKTSNFPSSPTCKIDNDIFIVDWSKVQRVKAPPLPRTTGIIRSLRVGHVLLFDVMEDINKIYQFHLLISVFSCVSKILFNLYFSIFGFITSSKTLPSKIQRGQMYIVCFWTVYYCLRFLLVVSFAHATAAESKKTKGTLVKIDPNNFEEPDKEEIKIFCENLSGRDFEFSAFGLFNLNMALIASSFSSGITYLVIMAQFH